MSIKRCAITLTMEYDFTIDGEDGGDTNDIKKVLKTVVASLELHSMHRILNTYGELLNVCAIPIKAKITPLLEGKNVTLDLEEGEVLKDIKE